MTLWANQWRLHRQPFRIPERKTVKSNYNPIIASLTIAFGALASLGAIIWQVTHGHDADAQLTGLAGLLFGAFLRMPGQTDQVTINQPADKPVPVTDDGHISLVEALLGLIALVIVLAVLVPLLRSL